MSTGIVGDISSARQNTSGSGGIFGTGPSSTAGGITSPVVVGGYKTDGSASASVLPAWFFPAAVAAGVFLLWTWIRRR